MAQSANSVNSITNVNNIVFIETNLSQMAASVFAGAQNVFLLSGHIGSPGSNPTIGGVVIVGFGTNACGGNGLTIDATTSNGTNISFSFSFSGPSGMNIATATGMISSKDAHITGTYSVPVGCGNPADSGTSTATSIGSFSGTWTGGLYGTQASLMITQGSDFGVSISGTYRQGLTLTLSGSIIGGSFEVTGTNQRQGNSVSLGGLYDPVGGNLSLYDQNTFASVGTLHR